MQKNTAKIPWRFFILSYIITWIIWLPGILATYDLIILPVPWVIFFGLGTFGPFFGAIIASASEGGKSGLHAYIPHVFYFAISLKWILAGILVPLFIAMISYFMVILINPYQLPLPITQNALFIIPTFLLMFLIGGGNEELGWRGYALDILQAKWSPLKASIILGLIWGVWHTPLFFIKYTSQFYMSWILFVLFSSSMSILHTWIYNASGKKVIAAWIFQASINTWLSFLPTIDPGNPNFSLNLLITLTVFFVTSILVVFLTGIKNWKAAPASQH